MVAITTHIVAKPIESWAISGEYNGGGMVPFRELKLVKVYQGSDGTYVIEEFREGKGIVLTKITYETFCHYQSLYENVQTSE